jgi:hypothetical protein
MCFKKMVLFPGYSSFDGQIPIDDFREMAQTARDCGFTHIDLTGSMVSRSRFQLTNNGDYCDDYDFYPEYTAVFPGLFKFYCPEALRSAIPADYTDRNLEELGKRNAILAEMGLKGAFVGNEPQWFPEEIYQQHPTWRGPQVDATMRSLKPYFAPCVDNEEVLELYREASRGIAKVASQIDTLVFLTGDSGSSLCWRSSYPGVNGPDACKNITMEDRVNGLVQAISCGFKDNSDDALVFLTKQPTWSYFGPMYPVVGFNSEKKIYFVRAPQDKPVIHENPLAILSQLEEAKKNEAEIVVVNVEHPQIQFKKGGVYPKLIKKYCEAPTKGFSERVSFLKELLVEFDPDNDSDDLLNAWISLWRGLDDSSRLILRNVFFYGGLSERWLTRPLLPIIESASEEEKMYYKKYIFNVLGEDVENDLLDYHGFRWIQISRTAAEAERTKEFDCASIRVSLDEAIEYLENGQKTLKGEHAQSYYSDMIIRIKALRCFLVNFENILEFQAIQDRIKAGNYPSFRASDKTMRVVIRRELDNCAELLNLIESCDSKLIQTAQKQEDENTFLFGVDLADQLKQKMSLMLKYWHDVTTIFWDRGEFNINI